MKHIILASKGKKNCQAAEQYALSECQKHGATLSIIHVVDYSLKHYGFVDMLATEIDKKDFVNYIHKVSCKEAQDCFVPLLETAQQNNVEATLYLEEGVLEDCLARYEDNADLVIIGGGKPFFSQNTAVFRTLSKRLSCPVRHIA